MIFGNTIDYSQVQVHEGMVAETVIDIMPAKSGQAFANHIFLSHRASKRTLMHELTHVWQWQNASVLGSSCLGKGFFVSGALVDGILNFVWHDWVYSSDIEPGRSFSSYRVEQQASIVRRIATDLLEPVGNINVDMFAKLAIPILTEIQGPFGPVSSRYRGYSSYGIAADLRAAPSNMLTWQVLAGYAGPALPWSAPTGLSPRQVGGKFGQPELAWPD